MPAIGVALKVYEEIQFAQRLLESGVENKYEKLGKCLDRLEKNPELKAMINGAIESKGLTKVFEAASDLFAKNTIDSILNKGPGSHFGAAEKSLSIGPKGK